MVTTVYIAVRGEHPEEFDVVGVFTSEEAALATPGVDDAYPHFLLDGPSQWRKWHRARWSVTQDEEPVQMCCGQAPVHKEELFNGNERSTIVHWDNNDCVWVFGWDVNRILEVAAEERDRYLHLKGEP